MEAIVVYYSTTSHLRMSSTDILPQNCSFDDDVYTTGADPGGGGAHPARAHP